MVLRDLDGTLGQLRVQREAQDDGPNERETNLKILYEKVYRSLQRTTEEIRKVHDDIEVLSQFCGGGAVPAVYDSYNVTEEDVDKMLDHLKEQHHHNNGPPQVYTSAPLVPVPPQHSAPPHGAGGSGI